MPQKVKNLIKLIFENAFRFLFNVGFVYLFQFLFGMQNTLAGVAIGVALTLFPVTPNGIGTLPMAGIIVGLFTACGLAAQLALVSPWLALPLNFLFVALIMLLTCEPLQQKPSITFLLCFVFCQATPVPAGEFPVRLLACFAGGALFGSFGVKLLSSKDAKKAYVHVTAAGLRMKDSVMGTVTTVQENAADILASAKELNEDRAAKEAEEAAAANLESEEA